MLSIHTTWPCQHNVDLSTECGFHQRVYNCGQIMSVLQKNIHILDINVRKLGLQVCEFSHVCSPQIGAIRTIQSFF